MAAIHADKLKLSGSQLKLFSPPLSSMLECAAPTSKHMSWHLSGVCTCKLPCFVPFWLKGLSEAIPLHVWKPAMKAGFWKSLELEGVLLLSAFPSLFNYPPGQQLMEHVESLPQCGQLLALVFNLSVRLLHFLGTLLWFLSLMDELFICSFTNLPTHRHSARCQEPYSYASCIEFTLC